MVTPILGSSTLQRVHPGAVFPAIDWALQGHFQFVAFDVCSFALDPHIQECREPPDHRAMAPVSDPGIDSTVRLSVL